MRVFGRLFCALLLTLCLTISGAVRTCASGLEPAVGEVLFAARYADYVSVADTGVWLGTSSWAGASLELAEKTLCVSSSSDQKTYLMLPADFTCGNTYTISYTFCFTDVSARNGYCGFVLTSRGDAPSNRMELIFRADGTVDGYGEAVGMAAAAAAGDAITVTVEVQHGFLIQCDVQCGAETTVFAMTHLEKVEEGGRGFVLRNASASLSSIEIVNGVDYPAKIGYYATHSYMAPTMPDAPGTTEPIAPNTPDPAVWGVGTFFLSGVFLTRKIFRRIKR